MKDNALKKYVESIPEIDPYLENKIYQTYSESKRKRNRKSILLRIVAIVTCCALAISIPLSINLFGNNRLIYDYERGAVAYATASNAQYAPSISKYLENNGGVSNVRAVVDGENTDSGVTVDEFQELISDYSRIQNYAGAGKYLGYDIFEVKEEIKFVIQNVPAFGQWFRLPSMREEHGFTAIPYYDNWAYLLEMNGDRLSITRVCWATRSHYYDFEKKTTVEEYADGSRFMQLEAMKIEYYHNEQGDEVVECYLYSVGIDKVFQDKKNYNANEADYYPFEYQYLKNVKDKSMVKYHITSAERLEQGMDIRGLYPYGYRREFTVVDYDGYENVTKTVIDTASDEEIKYNAENIQILLDTIAYPALDLTEISIENLIEDISKHIVDNFSLKNGWGEIYRNSANAKKVSQIYGPHYGQDMPISDVYMYIEVWSNQENFDIAVGAKMFDVSKFDGSQTYSLSGALKNRETGELIILGEKFLPPRKRYYNTENGPSKTEFYYELTQNYYHIDASVLQIAQEGTYDFVTVLQSKTYHSDEKTSTVETFDPLIKGQLMHYYDGLRIPDYQDGNGKNYKYYLSSTGGRLVMTVISTAQTDTNGGEKEEYFKA